MSSTRAVPSRSSIRCWCWSRPRRSGSALTARSDWRSSARAPRQLVLSRFSFALRGRALLWLAALASLPLLEPWRAPALLAGALAGYAFFTVVVWGSVYYHLRTGAPWTNGLRFWRLVLTNSDPTSGNALEQLPKLLIALAAGTLLAEEASAGSLAAGGRRGGDHRGSRRARRALVRAPAAALSGARDARARGRRRSRGAST